MTDAERAWIRDAVSDPIAVTCTLDGEGAGEPVHGQIAIGCAIRNRVNTDLGNDGKPDWWGEGYRQVCTKKDQFSCWWERNANSERVFALAKALLLKQPVGATGVVAQLRWVAEGIIGDALMDVTNGANHYCTIKLYREDPPFWVKRKDGSLIKPIASAGNHFFFKL